MEPESRSMPSNNRFWLNKDQGPLPAWSESPQDDPKCSVDDAKLRRGARRIQDRKLLAQGKNLKQQILMGTQGAGNQTEENLQNSDHLHVLSVETPCKSRLDRDFARHNGRMSAESQAPIYCENKPFPLKHFYWRNDACYSGKSTWPRIWKFPATLGAPVSGCPPPTLIV